MNTDGLVSELGWIAEYMTLSPWNEPCHCPEQSSESCERPAVKKLGEILRDQMIRGADLCLDLKGLGKGYVVVVRIVANACALGIYVEGKVCWGR